MSAEPAFGRSSTVLIRLLVTATIAFGIFLRLRMWWMDRSLWLDPAMVAVNLVEKNYGELWGTLLYNQSAPVGFLWLSKLAGEATGFSERALTLVPFLASVLALLAFAELSRRVLGLRGMLFALVPMAASSTAVYYSGELKPYSLDLLATVVVLLGAYRYWQLPSDGPGRSRVGLFLAAGIVMPWLSHASIIVVAGVGLVLFVAALRRDRRVPIGLSVAGALISIHFLLLYLLQIRPSVSQDLFDYYRGSFPPFPPWRDPSWYLESLIGYFSFPLGFAGSVGIPLLGLVLGLAAYLRRERAAGAVLLAPLGIVLMLSMAGLYPIITGQHEIHSRFVLFTIPLVLLVIGKGLTELTRVSKTPFLGLVVLVFLAYPSVDRMVRWPGYLQQEMRPLVTTWQDLRRPGDATYVFYASEPAFRFYTRDLEVDVTVGVPPEQEHLGLQVQAMKGRRVWVVMSHFSESQERLVDAAMAEAGRRKRNEKWFPGALLRLYIEEGWIVGAATE